MKMTRVTALASAAAVMLMISACSGGGNQSVADACTVAEDTVKTTVDDMQSDLEAAFGGFFYGEEVSLAEAFAPMVTAMNEAAAKVSNAEVETALIEFRDGVEQMGAVFDSFEVPTLDQSNMTDIEAIEEQTAALEEFSQVIEAEAKNLETSSQSLLDLCEFE